MKGFIVGIDKDKNRTLYRLVFIGGNGANFRRQMATEQDLIKALASKKVHLLNATLENGKLKGTTGDLKRFNNGKNKPFVVISEIKAGDKVLGYKVANYNGAVTNVKLADLMSYCEKTTKAGGVPVQNCMYVGDKDGQRAHLRSYPGYTLPVEKIERKKSANAKKPETVDKATNAKNKLETIFTKEQIKQLQLGKKNNVNIKIYANPKLSAEQMEVIRKALESGLHGEWIADPAYKVEVMKYLVADMKYGVDVSYYLNPEYSLEQLRELGSGFIAGVDVSKYADPSMSVDEMVRIREELEREVWKEDKVDTDSSWN